MNKKVSFITISSSNDGQRIDNFLFSRIKSVPKTRIYRAIRKGEVRINGKRCKAESKIFLEDKIRIPPFSYDEKEKKDSYLLDKNAKKIIDNILFEDDNFILLNKTVGMAVHSGTSFEYGIIETLRYVKKECDYLQLGHRIDVDTSGCLVVCKNRLSLLRFQRQLKQRGIKKNYICLVNGIWPKSVSVSEKRLDACHYREGDRRTIVSSTGKYSKTYFRIKSHFKVATLLEVGIITGRTHQIRAHTAAEGFPIVGDSKYSHSGKPYWWPEKTRLRVMLHAYSLEIPITDNYNKKFEAPLPDDFNLCLKILKNITV